MVNLDANFASLADTSGFNSLRRFLAILEVMIMAIAATVVWIPATIPARTIPPRASGITCIANQGAISSGTARSGIIARPITPAIHKLIVHIKTNIPPIQMPLLSALVFL